MQEKMGKRTRNIISKTTAMVVALLLAFSMTVASRGETIPGEEVSEPMQTEVQGQDRNKQGQDTDKQEQNPENIVIPPPGEEEEDALLNREIPPEKEEISPEQEIETVSPTTLNNNGLLTTKGTTSVLKAVQKPATPAGLKCYKVEEYLKITWTPSSGATGYEVYKSIYKDKGFSKVSTTTGPQNTMFVDKTVGPSATYYYKVRAINKSGSTTVASAYSSVTGGSPNLAVPTMLSAKDDVVRWQYVHYAQSYKVYEKPKGGSFKYIGTTTNTYYYMPTKAGNAYGVVAVRGSKTSDLDRSFVYTTKQFENTKVLLEGDSYCSGIHSYLFRAARLTGVQFDSSAYAGSWIADNTNTKDGERAFKSLYRRSLTTDYTKYNVIVISAGTNDYYYGAKLGTIKDKGGATFYGGYNTIIENIRKQNKTAKLILVMPSDRKAARGDASDALGTITKNSRGYTLEDYRNAVKAIGAKHGTYVYDLNTGGYMSGSNIPAGTIDNLHPTTPTYIKMGDAFSKFLYKVLMDTQTPSPDRAINQINALWISRHKTGSVEIMWRQKPNTQIKGWNIQTRTRKIGTTKEGKQYNWTAWTTHTYGTSITKATYSVPFDYVIEIRGKSKGAERWSHSVITTPAGGTYQAMKKVEVKNAANKKITSVTVKSGQTFVLKPAYTYPVANFDKRPPLYNNYAYWDVANASYITNLNKTAGMNYGAVRFKATLPKGKDSVKTSVVCRAPNGRAQTVTITIIK